MNSISFLVPLALVLGGIFAALFILAVRDGLRTRFPGSRLAGSAGPDKAQ